MGRSIVEVDWSGTCEIILLDHSERVQAILGRYGKSSRAADMVAVCVDKKWYDARGFLSRDYDCSYGSLKDDAICNRIDLALAKDWREWTTKREQLKQTIDNLRNGHKARGAY